VVSPRRAFVGRDSRCRRVQFSELIISVLAGQLRAVSRGLVSRCRSSTLRILPDMVLSSSKNFDGTCPEVGWNLPPGVL
jgi:hypothetical protein